MHQNHSALPRARIAFLGGAFDPVHEDHIRMALTCLQKGLADKVWLSPSPDRWDKSMQANYEHRFAMLQLAVEHSTEVVGLVPGALEVHGGESQGMFRGTYVLLESLQNQNLDKEFLLVIGSDSYARIPEWRDPMHYNGTNPNGTKLLQKFGLIVFEREGFPMPDILHHASQGFATLHLVTGQTGFTGHFASSSLRQSLQSGSECVGLLPQVHQYIRDHSLYESIAR